MIAFDSGVPGSDIPVTTVATDNKAAAAQAAEHLSELLGGKGKVAIVCNSQTSVTGQDREQGFRSWLGDNAPQAAQTAAMTDTVTIVGFDSGKPQMDLVTAGTIAGSITQNPYEMGYQAVVAAVKVLKGQSVESFIDSGFSWYDAENLGDEDIQKAVYE